MKLSLYIITFILTFSFTYADGSASFKDHVLPLLNKDKEFTKALLDSFDFNDSVLAKRMGSHTKFGGQRLGPYTVLAKPKGSKGSWIFEITVNTKYRVLDKEGKEIKLHDQSGKMIGLFNKDASSISESVINFELKKNPELNNKNL